ncbi:unnamed protein product [Brachionus calyciflorus]|uniref:Uncharacterized protein n=1 Tax=Brachionus calyciflorus TaxID=104777 RepID=A0A814KZM6_9BILA|nr:unnamed protein product [Brachionus calyciflorus]
MIEDSDKSIFYSIGILSIGLSIIIYGLDLTIMAKITQDGSIAMKSFNEHISYSNIFAATIVLCMFYIFGLVLSIYSASEKKELTILYSSCTIIIFNIPREEIVYKFFICFNYTYYHYVQVRACLSVLSVILLIIVHTKSTFNMKSGSENKKINENLLFTTSFLVLIGIGVLNMFTLVNLNTQYTKDINPETIKIGYFTEKEIAQIAQNNFIKDSNYPSRIISNLNDIIYSQNKRVAYRTCWSKSCTTYYIRTLKLDIFCNSESKKFYRDCSTVDKLIIELKYLDGADYPNYNCAVIEKNSTCRQGCPGLIDHQLYLVQEFNDEVELGWNGFCNCEVKKPHIKLTEDIELNICENKGSNLKMNYFSFIFLIILFKIKF